MGLKFFLVGTLWVQKFFYWVHCGSEFFSRGYFVGPKFLLQVYVGPKFFLVSILLASFILKSRIVYAIFSRQFSFISSLVHQDFESIQLYLFFILFSKDNSKHLAFDTTFCLIINYLIYVFNLSVIVSVTHNTTIQQSNF